MTKRNVDTTHAQPEQSPRTDATRALVRAVCDDLTAAERLALKEALSRAPEDAALMAAYEATARAVRDASPPAPDPSLSQRIMDRLPCPQSRRTGAAGRMLGAVYDVLDKDRVLIRLLGERPRHTRRKPRRCAATFLFAGSMHLIYGLILKAGLVVEPALRSLLPWWVTHQPLLAYVSGLFLLVLGVALGKNGARALSVAQAGALLYILFVLANGVLLLSTLAAPALLMASLGLVCSGLLIGLFLGAVLLKCTEESTES